MPNKKYRGKTVTFLAHGTYPGPEPENCPFCDAPKTKKDYIHETHYTCGLKLVWGLGGQEFWQMTIPSDQDIYSNTTKTMDEAGPEYYGCRKAHIKKKSKKNIS